MRYMERNTPNKPETPLQATYQKFWQEFNSFSAANDSFCKVFKTHPFGASCSYQDYMIGEHIRVVAGINFDQQNIRVGAIINNVDPALFFNEAYNYLNGIKGKGDLHMDTQGRTTKVVVYEYVEFDENYGWEIVFEKLISYMLQMKEAFWKVRAVPDTNNGRKKMAYYHRKPNKYEIIEHNSLFCAYFLQIYYIKKNNQIYYYNIHNPQSQNRHEELRSIEKSYNHIVSLIYGITDYGAESDYAYVLLWDDSGRSCIKDILSGKVLLDGFNKCHLQKVHKILDDEERYIKDFLFSIDKWGENDKEFFIYSLLEGYVFGPYKYSNIERYENGSIIDEKYVVEYNGFVEDISGYEKIDEKNNVYYNKESDCWFILEDEGEEFLHYLDDSDYSEIKEAEVGDYLYRYNIETKNLEKNRRYCSDYD